MLQLTQKNLFVGLLIFALGISVGIVTVSPVRLVNSQPQDPETELLHSIYSRVNKSVVSIQVRIPAQSGNSLGGGNGQDFEYAAGSGWMYDTQGHIVTNAHVVDQ